MKFFSTLIILCLFLTPGKKEKNTVHTTANTTFEAPVVIKSERISSGFLQTITFPSKHIGKRNVYVWTQDNYHSNKGKNAVLYMHDGQMLFDPEKTWNKQEWGVDETLTKLMKSGKIKNTIVVGIWNHPDIRHSEYFPKKVLDSLTKEQKDAVLKATKNKKPLFKGELTADNYLKFIVKELKPYIDKNFKTLTDQKNTYIAGSSMGGLISMYAMCEYPEVFGGAACLSTHWIGTVNSKKNPIPQAFVNYMTRKLPDPKTHKFYFDYGTRGLDIYYGSPQYKINKVMKAKGYTSKNWITRKFKGHDHSEKSWKKRLYIPATFLLTKK